MPPALQWNGQQTSLLMDPGRGKTLGAAVLGRAPGSCPHLGDRWLRGAGAGASSFQRLPLPNIWTSLLLGHQEANVTEGSRRLFCFVLFVWVVFFSFLE